MRLSVCRHPTMLDNTCGDCGVTIEQDDEDQEVRPTQNTVSMLHTMPGLKVSIAVCFPFFINALDFMITV